MINSKSIEDVGDFEKLVEKLPAGKAVALRVLRDGVTNFIAYTPAAEE
jgi:S1-C subfamily serine protease